VNTIFDTSGSTAGLETQNLSKDEFVASIIPKLQAILDRAFPNDPQKRKIRVYKDRINFAAPCCGDSGHDNHKKRGNIVLEGRFKNVYKCFNCGTSMMLPTFFKRYGQNLSLDEIDYITANRPDSSSFGGGYGIDSVSYLYDMDEVNKYAINRETFKARLGLVECDTVSFGHNYLVNRMQYDFKKFLYSVQANKLFILNLTPEGNILGIQVRRFDKSGPKYKTYGLQKIHEIIFRDGIVVPDDINTMSMLFNILLVDCTRVVTITEGPMDAFLLKNSIALCGAGKNIVLPFDQRYMFDSDKTGRQHTIEKLKDGYDVFLWDKYIKDASLPNRKKWDFNDVLLYARQFGLNLPSIEGYFSNDELDTIFI